MKKLIFLFLLSGAMASTMNAQDVLFTAKLKQEEVPKVIISAMERDYPDMTVVDYQAIPVEVIGDDWVVQVNNKNRNDKNYDTYTAMFSGPNVNGQVTYDKNGNLLSAREMLKNVPVPHPIQVAIGSTYPGWALTKDHEVLTVNRDGQKKVYYKIELTQGREKRKVVYDGNANEVREGRMHEDKGIG